LASIGSQVATCTCGQSPSEPRQAEMESTAVGLLLEALCSLDDLSVALNAMEEALANNLDPGAHGYSALLSACESRGELRTEIRCLSLFCSHALKPFALAAICTKPPGINVAEDDVYEVLKHTMCSSAPGIVGQRIEQASGTSLACET